MLACAKVQKGRGPPLPLYIRAGNNGPQYWPTSDRVIIAGDPRIARATRINGERAELELVLLAD